MSENKGLGVSGSSVEGTISHKAVVVFINEVMEEGTISVDLPTGNSYYDFCKRINSQGLFYGNCWYPTTSIRYVFLGSN
jgi:hypothetical protein